MILTLASILCAGVPMFGFLAAIWWLDRYDREPVWLLAWVFAWGAVGAVVVALIGSMIGHVLLAGVALTVGGFTSIDPTLFRQVTGPVLLAPLAEEPAKALILLVVISTRHFDNMTDGFVYGAAAGLGFGMTENFIHFASITSGLPTWGQTVVVRTFYTAVMHATATATVGAALGLTRFRSGAALMLGGGGGLIVAMGIHGVWNGLITLSDVTGGDGLYTLDLLLLPLQVATVFVIFEACLIEESRTIQRELREEAEAGRLPHDHPPILASWLRRLDPRWVPPGVDQATYVRLATDLAMRKKQARQLGDDAPHFYVSEVERLRERLAQLLTASGPEQPDPAGRTT